MHRVLIIALTVLVLGCASGATTQIYLKQHQKYAVEDNDNYPMMTFTFIGSLKEVSKQPYLNVHGEEWGMTISIEKMLVGKYDEKVVSVGIDDPQHPPLESGKRYYITVSWGRHGMMLREETEIKKGKSNQ